MQRKLLVTQLVILRKKKKLTRNMEHKENINEWQQIEQCPETSEWNMVMINENYLEVREEASSTNDPPIISPTHEELSLQIVPLQTTKTDTEDGTSSPLTASSSVSDNNDNGVTAPLDWRVRVVSEGKELLKLRLEAARARVVGVASKVGNWAMCAGTFWSFTHVAGAAAVAAVLVSLVYMGIRRRRRNAVDRWVYLLREKDEKISQLLFQIAQLNEVLSSRRKVPVHQIS